MQHQIAAYLRIATTELGECKNAAIELQKQKLQKAIEDNFSNKSQVKVSTKFYIDTGYSANDTNRPAYKKMMADIKSRKVNTILATNLERLSRNLEQQYELFETVKKHKVQIYTLG